MFYFSHRIVPTILGANGIEQVVELQLSEDEQQQLQISADSVTEVKQSLTNK